jgi:hypothetical protein
MRGRDVRVGRTYAFPTNPGPWHRFAVPARVMAHAPRDRVLVMLPDGVPASPTREAIPRAALVWIGAGALASSWEEWPAHAASARAELTFAVARSVAALGGEGAPTLRTDQDDRPRVRWWSRPITELLRPPALPFPDH